MYVEDEGEWYAPALNLFAVEITAGAKGDQVGGGPAFIRSWSPVERDN